MPRSIRQTFPTMYDPLPIHAPQEDPFGRTKRFNPYPATPGIEKLIDLEFRRPRVPSFYDLPVAGWSRPLDMVICLKRKIRREMIHVMRHILGKNFRPRSPKFTQWSKVRCS